MSNFDYKLQMEVWESNEYNLLNSPLVGNEMKLDDLTSTDYLEWINWDHKNDHKSDNPTIPTSNSSDSGLSSDFNYDQQLSPCNFFLFIHLTLFCYHFSKLVQIIGLLFLSVFLHFQFYLFF